MGQKMAKEVKVDAEPISACCTPAPLPEGSCCPPKADDVKGLSLWKSIGIFLGLVVTFVISDYWFGSFLASHLAGFSASATD